MSLSKMIQADNLLEDDDDENISYLNFYEENLQFLKEVHLRRVPDSLKFEVAVLFFISGKYENEWIGVLEELGVDYKIIHAIDYKSGRTGKLPIYLALNGVLQYTSSFGDFIDVLCKRGKFNILRILKPFVEELLLDKHSLNEEGFYSGPPPPSAPQFSSLEITNSLTNSYDCRVKTQHDSGYSSVTCQKKKEHCTKGHETALEHFQNSEIIPSFGNHSQLSGISNFQNVNKPISVFIMHSMSDEKYAKKLAKCLKKKNFEVKTSANIYPLLRQNPTLIMKAVDERVDFVIPVISKSFMKQIEFTGYYATEKRDLESEANTFMYDRLLNEYSSRSNFFNCRVKPVCYSLEIRKIENNDQILARPTYLSYTDLKNDKMLEKEFLELLKHS